MNERIKLLKDKLWTEEYWTNPNTDKLLPAQLNSFAELIVRECVNVCKEQEYKYWRSSEEDQWTPIDSANAIEEHFGVEVGWVGR